MVKMRGIPYVRRGMSAMSSVLEARDGLFWYAREEVEIMGKVECRCVDAGFPCRAEATQEDMLCDHCRQRGCRGLLGVRSVGVEDVKAKEGFDLL